MNTFHHLCNFLCGRSLQIIGLFILGIVGISSPHYQASLDVSSPQAKPYSGPHPDDNKDQSE